MISSYHIIAVTEYVTDHIQGEAFSILSSIKCSVLNNCRGCFLEKTVFLPAARQMSRVSKHVCCVKWAQTPTFTKIQSRKSWADAERAAEHYIVLSWVSCQLHCHCNDFSINKPSHSEALSVLLLLQQKSYCKALQHIYFKHFSLCEEWPEIDFIAHCA